MAKKIKVCVIPSTFLPIIGGAEIQCHNFSNLLCQKKIDVDLWSLTKINLKNNMYKIKFFNMFLINVTYYLEYYFSINISFFLKIYLHRIIKKYNYDIFHFHSLNYKLLMLIRELKKLNQKVIVTFQGADIQINKKINYGYRLKKNYDHLLRSTIKKIDLIHSISNNIDLDLKKLGVKKKNIIKIPNTVYLKKTNNNKSHRKYKILKLITVARFAEKKKGFDFIDKIGEQLKGRIDFKWYIIGKNSHKLTQYKFVRENKDKFKIIPQISNFNEKYFPHSSLIKLYQQSDIYVHLSRIESFGISLIEAMSVHLPILAIKAKGSNELLKDKINGYFFSVKKNNFYTKILNIKNKKLNQRKLINFNKEYTKKFDL